MGMLIDYSIEVQNKISSVLKALKQDGMPNYIGSDFNEMTISACNKITESLIGYRILPKGYNVVSIWYNEGDFGSIPYFNITAFDRTYKVLSCSSNLYCGDIYLEENAANDVINVIGALESEIRTEILNDKTSIEEIYQCLIKLIRKNIINEYYADFENGKLNKENDINTYKCIVIRNNDTNSYVASITLNKDALGYYIHTRIPLCGESKMRFKMDEAETTIIKALKRIGVNIN